MESVPILRIIDKETKNPQIIIQCSNCEIDIRQMSKTELLDPRKGIYCKKCDDGLIHLNMPVRNDE